MKRLKTKSRMVIPKEVQKLIIKKLVEVDSIEECTDNYASAAEEVKRESIQTEKQDMKAIKKLQLCLIS